MPQFGQELRVIRPLNPAEVKAGPGGWQGQTRGQTFLKKNRGIGGGYIPGYDDSILLDL